MKNILATDMKCHFDGLKEFKRTFLAEGEGGVKKPRRTDLTEEETQLITSLFTHVAD